MWHRAFQHPLPWERVGVRGFRSQQKVSGPLTLALSRRAKGQHKCFWHRPLELNLAHMPIPPHQHIFSREETGLCGFRDP